jgi:RNA polymerase sigma factor for flagellar operon FliA
MSKSDATVLDECLDDQEVPSGTFRRAPSLRPTVAPPPHPDAARVTADELRDYMHLVRMVAGRFLRRLPPNVQRDDLLAAGTIGLTDALRKHRGERGPQFEGYARVRIRGAILDELRREDWLSRRARARVRVADPGGVAMQPAMASFDDPSNRLPEPSDGYLAERYCERVALSDAIRRLPAREGRIVELHYIDGIELTEIAAMFGVSVPRVSQLHTRALGLLREFLTANDQDQPARKV